MQLIRLILVISLVFSSANIFASGDNLTEIENRKSRLETATWGYSVLEDESDNYNWQSENLSFVDEVTGVEKMRVGFMPGGGNLVQDIAWPTVSGNGEYITFRSFRSTAAWSPVFWDNSPYGLWMMSRTDGTVLRTMPDSPIRTGVRWNYFTWSPVHESSYYVPGSGSVYAGEQNLSINNLYRVSVTDTEETPSLILSTLPDISSTAASKLWRAKKSISGDGTTMMFTGKRDSDDAEVWVPVTVFPTPAMLDADGYSRQRPWNTYWGLLTDATTTIHDEYLAGSGSGIRHFILPENLSGKGIMSITPTGTAADGGPQDTTNDQTYPYDFGGEIDYLNMHNDPGIVAGECVVDARDPWCCADDEPTVDCETYWSHFSPDRWANKMVYANIQNVGPSVSDINSHTDERTGYTGSVDIIHTDYHAWSDYWIGNQNSKNGSRITLQHYTDDDFTVLGQSWTKIDSGAAVTWLAGTTYNKGDYARLGSDDGPQYCSNIDNNIGNTPPSAEWDAVPYEAISRPTQSPDGTKVYYHSTIQQQYEISYDLYYIVAYYPYAPEIISVSGGVVRFDYRTDQTTSRGYTQRGWPDESTDDPPPPREIKAVRLWKSANGTTGWEPVGTVSVNYFDRYNFSTGVWTGNKYYEVTDPSPSGYYAVTAIEHSGLESRALSNVFSAAGSQTAAYPADPGGDENIISTYNSDCHRYYNIHAADGSTPAISQTTRIASDPRTTKEFIDVFGKDDDTTLYTVTAVDSQGNESAALDVTVQTDTPSAGIYTVSWADTPTPSTTADVQADMNCDFN